MGCCQPGGLCGPELEMDEDLAPVCKRLNLSVKDAMFLYEKFKEIDFDMSGVVDLDEFFEHLCEEKTPFATQLFTLIDENASGEIDFNEFLVGLWNICTFDEESMLRFAFDLVDADGSGFVDADEMEGMIKGVHGSKYDKKLFLHTKKVLKQYDANGDNQFSFDEFKKCHKKLPLLFMPAFSLMNKMQTEFYGHDFWKSAAKARNRDRKAQRVRDFLALNKEIQLIAPGKYTGDQMAQAVFRAQQRTNKIHEASYDKNKMRADAFDPAKKRRASHSEKLHKEHHRHESSGIKAFSLDETERLGLDDDVPAVREDRRRGWDEKQGWKSVAKVAPSQHDKDLAEEVQGMRQQRQNRGNEGVVKPKPKAMQGAGKKVANPMHKNAKGGSKSRRGSDQKGKSAKVAPRR